MAKRSGWGNWKARFSRYGRRARDTGDPGDSSTSLDRFVTKSRGPVAVELEQGLMTVNDQGEFVVARDAVKPKAQEMVKSSQDASYPRDYLVKSYQEVVKLQGGNLTYKQAENGINKDQAARAEAILVAAKIGKVKLTDAQRERLERISQGEYLDLVYGQYKSGDRGTLVGVRSNGPISKGGGSEKKAEKRREFMQFLSESRQAA